MVNDVPITGDSIRLGQLLKLADLVSVGGDASPSLPAGRSRSTARRRPGAAVSWSGATWSGSVHGRFG